MFDMPPADADQQSAADTADAVHDPARRPHRFNKVQAANTPERHLTRDA
jgi:hypothetical protein